MTFGIVPPTEWRLRASIGERRKDLLLRTSFDVIVQRLNKDAQLHDYKRQEMKRFRGSARAWVKLVVQSNTVDVFHNGAAGYRAQFYIGTEQGEAANRYAIDSLLITLKSLCSAMPKSDCCWGFLEASLCRPDAKIWIYEGAWLSSNKPEDRNLTADRWEQNAHKITLKHRFELAGPNSPLTEKCI